MDNEVFFDREKPVIHIPESQSLHQKKRKQKKKYVAWGLRYIKIQYEPTQT